MKITGTKLKICLSCMEEHEVKQVEIEEENSFKGVNVSYMARYEYCDNTEEYLTYDDSLETNDLAMKDAYRKKKGLLTSQEIIEIRKLYSVSQKDFSKILGWGSSTITRYENHQVQDGIHDDVLKKVFDDPKWFLDLLERARGELRPKAYHRYLEGGQALFQKKQGQYAIDCIEAAHANYRDKDMLTGKVPLDLDKVVALINYLASKVDNLHLVKLMKMMWYSDNLHYKWMGKAITGLVYVALPMGAVPDGYKNLLHMDGLLYEEVAYNEAIAYKFKAPAGFEIDCLSPSEIEAIDQVIEQFKNSNASDIVTKMHDEEAYKKTALQEPISYEHAESLSI